MNKYRVEVTEVTRLYYIIKAENDAEAASVWQEATISETVEMMSHVDMLEAEITEVVEL